MKVLTVANRKGGVAKTTVCQIFAPYAAGVLNLNVLIVDLDEQGSLSLRYVPMKRTTSSDLVPTEHPDSAEIRAENPNFKGWSASTDIFSEGVVYEYGTQLENLDILPAYSHAVRELNKIDFDESVQSRLFHFVNHQTVIEMGWDLIIIDTPPAMNALTLSAVRASTHVLIPSIMEQKSIEGLISILAKIRAENMKKPKQFASQVVGVLPTLFQKNQTIHRHVLEKLRETENIGNLVFENIMYDRSDIRKMDTTTASPITPFDNSGIFATNSKQECENWCNELARKMKLI